MKILVTLFPAMAFGPIFMMIGADGTGAFGSVVRYVGAVMTMASLMALFAMLAKISREAGVAFDRDRESSTHGDRRDD